MLHRLKEIIYKRYNISFSNSGDDMLLKRLINKSKPGTYVDIGCWDPIKSSNTYYFSLRGWKGICIDPNPELIETFKKYRPNDIFINNGIGLSSKKEMKYYMLQDYKSDMNTFNSEFLVEKNLMDKVKRTIDIPIVRLDSILSKHISENERLDFFDIDAESFDLEVLKTNDWQKFRPQIVLVESAHNLKNDINSEITLYLESKNYELIGKTMNHENSGNLYFKDLKK